MTQPSPDKKIAGALAPLFALRGQQDLGIGDTATLHELIDWAAGNGLGFVQMLPINQTGSDHSPYNLLSSMAIEPLTLSCHPRDLPGLQQDVYLKAAASVQGTFHGPVDYPAVKERKFTLFRQAANTFFSLKKTARHREFQNFVEDEEEWLDPYALHQALMERNGGAEILDRWPEEHRSFESARQWEESLPNDEQATLEESKRFYRYLQWVAHRQWLAARKYAEKRGVFLIGDVPVGVSIYSVDVWTHPHLFDLQRSCGAPPEKVFQADPFTMKWGQNWGFPLYDWFAMSKDNFAWWRQRLRSLREIFAILRVDHALGFFRIYSFPWRPEHNAEFTDLSHEEAMARTGGLLPGFVPHEDDTPEHQEANRLHGETLLGILAEETGREGLIAEDLGEVPPYVRPSLARMGLAGFKVPQWETEPDGLLTPGDAYPRMSITTYATHDHPPLCEIWNQLIDRAHSPETDTHAVNELRALILFCGGNPDTWMNRHFDFEVLRLLLGGLWKSNSWLAAANINDLFGTADRFNVPGTSCAQNWSARLEAPIHSWESTHAPAIAAWNSEVAAARPTR